MADGYHRSIKSGTGEGRRTRRFPPWTGRRYPALRPLTVAEGISRQTALASVLTDGQTSDWKNEQDRKTQAYQRDLVAAFRDAAPASNITEEQCFEFAKFMTILGLAPRLGGLPGFVSDGDRAKKTKQWHAVGTISAAVADALKREQNSVYHGAERVRDLKRALATVERLPVLLGLSPPRRAHPRNDWTFLANMLARYAYSVLVKAGRPPRSLEPKGALIRVVCDVLCRVTGRSFTWAQVSGVLKRERKALEAELAKFERGDDFGWDA